LPRQIGSRCRANGWRRRSGNSRLAALSPNHTSASGRCWHVASCDGLIFRLRSYGAYSGAS
jgi:hypothetical protein